MTLRENKFLCKNSFEERVIEEKLEISIELKR